MKSNGIDSGFWREFQNAVVSAKTRNVAELSYFESDEDREDFIDNFEEIFDETARDSINSTKAIELKRVVKSREENPNSPFEALILPDFINEVYVFHTAYFFDDDNEEYGYDNYSNDYGKSSLDDDPDFDDDYESDYDFGDDQVIDYYKAFVFGKVENEFKYLGSYTYS